MTALPFTVEHFSRDSFIRLLDFYLEHFDVPKVYVSRNPSGVPPSQRALFVQYPSFDLVLSGKKHLLFGDGPNRDLKLSPGDIHYCPAGHWKVSLWDHYHAMSSIIFYPEFVRITFIDYDENCRVSYANRGADLFFHTKRPIGEAGRHAIMLLNHLIRSDVPEELLRGAVRLILQLTRESIRRDDEVPDGKRTANVQRIKQYLQGNFQYGITREFVARKFGITPCYLTQLLSASGAGSFIVILRKLRMDHAGFLLTCSDLSVGEIALECGYQSNSHFIAEFKKEFKVSPGQFRRQNLEC